MSDYRKLLENYVESARKAREADLDIMREAHASGNLLDYEDAMLMMSTRVRNEIADGIEIDLNEDKRDPKSIIAYMKSYYGMQLVLIAAEESVNAHIKRKVYSNFLKDWRIKHVIADPMAYEK